MKKKYPTLTPAAWRKAAAQELGMDYNTYLSIWKQNKGAKVAQKLVAEPKPTIPAAQAPGPKMVPASEADVPDVTFANYQNNINKAKSWKSKDYKNIPKADDIIPEDPYATLFKGQSGAESSTTISDAVSMNALGPGYKHKFEDVWVSDIISGQKMSTLSVPLKKPQIRRLVAEGIPQKGAKGLLFADDVVNAPLLVRIDGQLYMIDGHHRAIAAALRGEKIRAEVIDLTGKVKAPKITFNKPKPISPASLAELPTTTAASEILQKDLYDYAWDPNFYGKVHDALRNGTQLEDWMAQKVERITELLKGNKTQAPMTVYRGMMHDPKLKSDLISKWKSGEKFTDDAFMSTTKTQDSIVDFLNDDANDIEMVIKVPKGTEGYYIGNSLKDFPGAYNQDEFLLQRGTSLFIKDIKTLPDGGIKVYAEVAGQAPKPLKVAAKESKAPLGQTESEVGAIKAQKDLDEVVQAFKEGSIDSEMVDDAFKYMMDDIGGYNLTESQLVKMIGKAKDEVDAFKAVAGDTVQTTLGPLTHDLAQSVYKQMKKDMPGATPAVWRHNAAKYLGVDYNDYLLAWKKKPGTGAIKKLPADPNVSLSPTKVGKYSNSDIDADQLKAELCTLYGPEAQPQYINLIYDEFDGSWSVQFPSSLLKSQAAMDKVAHGLKQLGLNVAKTPNMTNYYKISSTKAKQTVKANIKQIKQTGTFTLPDGKVVLDSNAADSWTESWWSKLNSTTRDAWKNYTASGYRTINGALRGKQAMTSAIKAKVKLISESMPKLEHQMMVFRGSPLDISTFRNGELWKDKGFMSTAINPGSAWTGVKFEITCPKGTRGMFIGKRSSHPHENEFLLDAGTEFRVLEVDKANNIVRLVAIPH